MSQEKIVITVDGGERDMTFLGVLTHEHASKQSLLTVGWAARNPEDKIQPELAHTIAEGRASKKPFFTVLFRGPKPSKDFCTNLIGTAAKDFINKLGYHLPATRKHGKRTETQFGKNPVESSTKVHS